MTRRLGRKNRLVGYFSQKHDVHASTQPLFVMARQAALPVRRFATGLVLPSEKGFDDVETWLAPDRVAGGDTDTGLSGAFFRPPYQRSRQTRTLPKFQFY